jgi:hypothetical protein
MRKVYPVKPLAQIFDMSQAPLNASPLSAQWPSLNVMVSSNRIERRWDHEVYRTLDDTEVIQHIPIYRTNLGTQYTLILTETDLAKVMGGTGETYQYLTDTYTTGAVTGITGAVVTGNGSCLWNSSGLAAGDKFIMATDLAAAVEPDANWATILTVDSDTQITLSASYTGATTSGDYRARKVYSVPTSERWQYASVDGKFCFGNGNVYMQYWDGTSTYATNLDLTYCNQVRYCTSYANRLVIGDMYDADISARNPWKVRWSKEGDPTNWTDDTSGFNDFIDTEEPIVGLGVSGDNLIVFKNTSYYVGYRTGQSTSPISFPSKKPGIGLYAPYSLVNAMGTVLWMGVDDFYFLNGDVAEPVGGPIRKKFFELVSDDEAKAVFGINNIRYNEILWVANTSSGQCVFAYDWKEKVWSVYQFPSNLTGLGGFGF